jgi:hypothetical protein
MRCGHKPFVLGQGCTREQLHDGDHSNGKKTWSLDAVDLERLVVQEIRAGNEDAAVHYTQGGGAPQ